MKKTITIFIAIIILLNIPLRVNASSVTIPYNPGINPSVLSESELTSWLFSLYGVRSHNTTLLDNTNYLSLVEAEMKKLDPDFDINEFKNEVYTGYVAEPYKVTIPRNKFIQLGEAIGSTFALASAINVKVQVPDGEGAYNADYTIDRLNDNFLLNYNGLKSYTMFTNIFVNYANRINSIHAFNTSYATYNSTTIVFSLDNDWTINNNIATFQSDWLLFVCNVENGGITGTSLVPRSKYDTLALPQDGIIEIGKSNTIDGIVSINPDFTQALIDGAYALITPYTMDITSEDVTVAIPNNVAGILEGITAGTISGEQAIADSRAIPVDITDPQAIASAQQAVGSSVPEFQTIGLADLFPFCIPFDIVNFLRAFTADPQAPEFDIKLPNGKTIDGKIQYDTYHVSFAQFNWIAEIVRSMEVVAFCVMLALATRNRMVRS